jgi:hypothetical protein
VPAALREWALEREVDLIHDGEVALLRLRFTRGEGIVSITVMVFPGPERGRVAEHLLATADAVTTVELSDVRGPEDLGTLSLLRGSGDTLYWMFRNVFAEVVVYRADVDAVELAREVQRHLEASVRPR